MRQIALTLPTNLLCRFRALASEMLCLPVDVLTEEEQPSATARERHASIAREVHFHEALASAVAEAMRAHASLSPLEEPPATLVPYVTVYSAVPEAAADFVAQLAARSGLTTAQAWHRVVLEFCERSEAPGLEVDVPEEVADVLSGDYSAEAAARNRGVPVGRVREAVRAARDST